MGWKEEYNIGVEIVDKAHKQLFSIIRRIKNFLEDGDDKRRRFACEEGIKFFKSYAVKHFAQEEGYMLSIGYDRYEGHHVIHEIMKNQTLPVLEAELEESDYSDEVMEHFLGVCIGWLITHIMIEDQAIAGKVKKKKWDLESKSEISVIQEILSAAIQQTFGIESTLLDEHCKEWDFTDALYYEQQYAGANDEKLNIVVAMEEQFVLATTGHMMGMDFSEVDQIVIFAEKQIISGFIHEIMDVIDSKKQYRFVSDQMRDGEIPAKEYGERSFQYSLVFSTACGRYIFCLDRPS